MKHGQHIEIMTPSASSLNVFFIGHRPAIVKRAVIGSKVWVEAQHNILVVKCFMIGQ